MGGGVQGGPEEGVLSWGLSLDEPSSTLINCSIVEEAVNVYYQAHVPGFDRTKPKKLQWGTPLTAMWCPSGPNYLSKVLYVLKLGQLGGFRTRVLRFLW